jgi:hypothetical protein
MLKNLIISLIWFWALSGLLFPAPSRGEDRSPESGGQAGAKPGTSATLQGKAQKEMKEVQKDTRRTGHEIQQSAKELPAQAGKEFKKTERALKNAGKEIKDNAKESFEDIKKLLKK